MAIVQEQGFDYAFDPSACAACGGACCTGERGMVRIGEAEIGVLAHFLGDLVEVVQGCYLRQERSGWVIKERQGELGWSCWFFDDTRRMCRIYSVRPRQCRTFPFWGHFRTQPDSARDACVGVLK